MDAEEFYKRVSVRSGIHGRDHVIEATASVFDALTARITDDTSHNIAAQLPAEIKRLWEEVREPMEFERMDLDEFLDRIQTRCGLTGPGDAGELARAVFTTLQEQITPGAAQKVASELPGDIRAFWRDSTPEERPIESPASQRRSGSRTGRRIENPALAEHFEEGDGPEITATPEAQRQGSPEGQYTSEEIGPAAASVHRSDEQLKAEIEDLLQASDEVDASNIDVEVHAGRVTLRGIARTPMEREAAKRIAREALGTVELDVELRLQHGE